MPRSPERCLECAQNSQQIFESSFATPAPSLPSPTHLGHQAQGRRVCQRLQGVIDRQQFEVVIQAKVGAKVLARERVAPYRKDVLIKSGKTVGGETTHKIANKIPKKEAIQPVGRIMGGKS